MAGDNTHALASKHTEPRNPPLIIWLLLFARGKKGVHLFGTCAFSARPTIMDSAAAAAAAPAVWVMSEALQVFIQQSGKVLFFIFPAGFNNQFSLIFFFFPSFLSENFCLPAAARKKRKKEKSQTPGETASFCSLPHLLSRE